MSMQSTQPLHDFKPHEMNNFGRAGTNNKNPIQNEAPQMPEDVERFHREGKDYEIHGVAHGPKNPATGSPMLNAATDKLNEPIENLSPDPAEHILTTAEDTMTGATSKDVNRSLGAPAQGMSSRQMHTANQQQHRKREHAGVQQFGPQGAQLDLGQSEKAREFVPEKMELGH